MPTTLHEPVVSPRVGEALRAEVGPSRFQQFFGCVRLDLTPGVLCLTVPSDTYARWLFRQFGRELLESAKRASGGETIRIEWRVEPALAESSAGDPAQAAPRGPASPAKPVRPGARRHAGPDQFSLAEFVVGEGNRLAHAMATRLADPAAEPPARILFIHGACGVGKTHLLCGTARAFNDADPRARVRYTTGEEFTNEYIAALRSGNIASFQSAVRRLDLLCIDDVHFLGGRPKTQEEFLHTFDALQRADARIVLASDSEPGAIRKFHRRLASLCLGGMVVQVSLPDRTTLSRIVERVARRRGLTLDEGGVAAIVSACDGSVRNAEGLLARLHAHCTAVEHAGMPACVGSAMVQRVACATAAASAVRRPAGFGAILDAACEYFGVEAARVRGRGRHRRLVLVRSIVSYLAREMTSMSYPEIAQALGYGSHSTVIDGEARIRDMLERNDECEADAAGNRRCIRDACGQVRNMAMNARWRGDGAPHANPR